MQTVTDKHGNVIGYEFDPEDSLSERVELAKEVSSNLWSGAFTRADVLRDSLGRDDNDFEVIREAFGYQTDGGAMNHSRLAWFEMDNRRADIPVRTYQSMCGLGKQTEEKEQWANRLFELGEKVEKRKGAFPDAKYFSRVKRLLKAAHKDGLGDTSLDGGTIDEETFKTSIAVPLTGNENLEEQIAGIVAYAVAQFMEHLEGRQGLAHFEIIATAFTANANSE